MLETFNNKSMDRQFMSKLPAWLTWDSKSCTCFFVGALASFVVAYIGVARPTTLELARLERQLVRLERSVEKVAGQADSAEQARGLLASLIEQGRHSSAAADSLAQIDKLHQHLIEQSAEATRALAAFDALKSEATRIEHETALAQANLQQILAENAQGLERMHQTVNEWNDLHDRLAHSGSLNQQALDVSNKLLSLQTDLVCRGGHADAASEALDQLLAIRGRLDGQRGIEDAQQRLEQLVGLQDQVVRQTGDLATAIETIELSGDLHRQLEQILPSLQQMRTSLTEILVLQPTFERAMAALQPLTELGNLRRLNVQQLRQVADNLARPQAAPLSANSLITSQGEISGRPAAQANEASIVD